MQYSPSDVDYTRRSRSRSPVNRSQSPVRSVSDGKKEASRIVLANVPYQLSWKEIKDWVKTEVGESAFCVPQNDENGRFTGVVQLQFNSAEVAQKALESLNKKELNGRQVVARRESRRDRSRAEAAQSRIDSLIAQENFEMLRRASVSAETLKRLEIGPAQICDTIFVANLDYQVDNKKLLEIFRLAGSVRSVDIRRDDNGRSRGYGTIRFDNPLTAIQAISMFRNQILFGRCLSVRMDELTVTRTNLERFQNIKNSSSGQLELESQPARHYEHGRDRVPDLRVADRARGPLPHGLQTIGMSLEGLSQRPPSQPPPTGPPLFEQQYGGSNPAVAAAAATVATALGRRVEYDYPVGGPSMSQVPSLVGPHGSISQEQLLGAAKTLLAAFAQQGTLGNTLPGAYNAGANPLGLPPPPGPAAVPLPVSAGTVSTNQPFGYEQTMGRDGPWAGNYMSDRDARPFPSGSSGAADHPRKLDVADLTAFPTELRPSTFEVMVRNLKYDVDWKTLRNKLKTAGTVAFVQMLKNNDGKPSGRAKVRFETSEAARRACELFNNTLFEGRHIFVQMT